MSLSHSKAGFKVMTVVGTRPEIIRLSRVIAKLDQHVQHVLVHTGQNYDYELNEIFFKDLELRKPDFFLESAGRSAGETVGNVIAKVDALLESEKPDALLVLGDTNSCLSVIAAKRRKIPIFHMEAGNRCFDSRVPEEINRKIVDHTSDINLPYSDIARSYLIAEGLPPARIIKTGSPMLEILTYHRSRIDASDVLTRLELKEQDYFVVSTHREENVDYETNLKNLVTAINRVAEEYGKRIIYSMHPRTKARMPDVGLKFHPLVSILKPLGFLDYVKLQMHAKAVLSDSGTITEESSILNFPAINIREAHERPEGMEETSVIMTGTDPDHILRCLALAIRQPRGSERLYRPVRDYDVPNLSDKMVRLILSYTSYVNREVWRKT